MSASTTDYVSGPVRRMFLNGTAMSGQADHAAVAGAVLLGPRRTAPRYRFLAVRDSFPGLLPVERAGVGILGELYEMPAHLLLDGLLPQEPAELELGTIELEGGDRVHSMLLRPERLSPHDRVVDIADLGGWLSYRAHLAANAALPALLDRLSSTGAPELAGG